MTSAMWNKTLLVITTISMDLGSPYLFIIGIKEKSPSLEVLIALRLILEAAAMSTVLIIAANAFTVMTVCLHKTHHTPSFSLVWKYLGRKT